MILAALPDGAVALGVGTVLALGAAAVVLLPLLRDEPPIRPSPSNARPMSVDGSTDGSTDGSSAVDALREIEFDRATGKLSDDDYGALKATYTRAALTEMRARDAAGASSTTAAVDDDLVEQTIRRFRAGGHAATCPADGPRPEPDARFCSACGRFLAGRCASCGEPCDEEGQRFCTACGTALAA